MEAVPSYSDHPWIRFYEEGVPAHLEYPNITVGEVLSRTVSKFPDHTALLFFGKKISYEQLDALVNRFAHALAGLGVKKGDRVALMLPNIPQMVIAYYGTLRMGAIAVATNPLYHEHELEVQLRDSGAETLVAVDMFYPVISRALPKNERKTTHPLRHQRLSALPAEPALSDQGEDRKAVGERESGYRRSMTFCPCSSEAPDNSGPNSMLSPDDTAILQYTGGTTGTPKGAILTHRNLVANAVHNRVWLTRGKEGEERILAVIPFFHVYGMTTAMNLGVLMGAELILLPKFHTREVLTFINKYRPTIFPGIQAMYLAISNYPKIKKYDLTSIKAAISGAGPLMHEVQERFEQLTKARIVEGYGLSEASPVTHCNPVFGKRKPGSIGLPFPDMEAKIVDIETGEKEVPVGETGELVVKGPQVMKGYWNKPDETAHALRGGWLHTGDIAKMDEDGFFYIVDRIKDMIKTVGENVYPREIEEVLFMHPKVKDAVVVGIPHEEFLGEKIKAYIVLKEGETATAEEIIQFCREQLSKFKVPKEVEFRDQLPKTLVGKVLRRILRDEEMKKLETKQ